MLSVSARALGLRALRVGRWYVRRTTLTCKRLSSGELRFSVRVSSPVSPLSQKLQRHGRAPAALWKTWNFRSSRPSPHGCCRPAQFRWRGAWLALLRRWRKTAWVLIGSSLTALYSQYLPGSERFARQLGAIPGCGSGTLLAEKVQAIVVLGGGRYPVGPEFGAETVSVKSFSRLRYAAHLHRKRIYLFLPPVVLYGESRSRQNSPK